MHSEAVPAFLQIEAAFVNWPDGTRAQVTSQRRPIHEQRYATEAQPDSTCWELIDYERLDAKDAMTTTFCEQFTRLCHTHLPLHRRLCVGLLRCDVCFFKDEVADFAVHVVHCMPSVLLTLEQLHHFLIVVADFRPGTESIGHFNLYHLLSLYQLGELRTEHTSPVVQILEHLDSIGASQRDALATVQLFHRAADVVLGRTSSGFRKFDVCSPKFINAFRFYALRDGLPLEGAICSSGYQRFLTCACIASLRALMIQLGIRPDDDVAVLEHRGLELIGELGFVFKSNLRLKSERDLFFHVPNVPLKLASIPGLPSTLAEVPRDAVGCSAIDSVILTDSDDDGALQPAEGAPQLTDGARQLTDGAPQPTDGAPQPTDGAPQLTDGAPQLTDGAPQPTDGAPQPTDGAPQPTDGAPQPTDGALQPTDGALQLTDGAPQLTDGAPQLKDGAPQPTYGAPQLTDGAPELAGGAPQLAGAAPQLTDAVQLTGTLFAVPGASTRIIRLPLACDQDQLLYVGYGLYNANTKQLFSWGRHVFAGAKSCGSTLGLHVFKRGGNRGSQVRLVVAVLLQTGWVAIARNCERSGSSNAPVALTSASSQPHTLLVTLPSADQRHIMVLEYLRQAAAAAWSSADVAGLAAAVDTWLTDAGQASPSMNTRERELARGTTTGTETSAASPSSALTATDAPRKRPAPALRPGNSAAASSVLRNPEELALPASATTPPKRQKVYAAPSSRPKRKAEEQGDTGTETQLDEVALLTELRHAKQELVREKREHVAVVKKLQQEHAALCKKQNLDHGRLIKDQKQAHSAVLLVQKQAHNAALREVRATSAAEVAEGLRRAAMDSEAAAAAALNAADEKHSALQQKLMEAVGALDAVKEQLTSEQKAAQAKQQDLLDAKAAVEKQCADLELRLGAAQADAKEWRIHASAAQNLLPLLLKAQAAAAPAPAHAQPDTTSILMQLMPLLVRAGGGSEREALLREMREMAAIIRPQSM